MLAWWAAVVMLHLVVEDNGLRLTSQWTHLGPHFLSKNSSQMHYSSFVIFVHKWKHIGATLTRLGD